MHGRASALCGRVSTATCITQDIDNIRAALTWAFATGHDVDCRALAAVRHDLVAMSLLPECHAGWRSLDILDATIAGRAGR